MKKRLGLAIAITIIFIIGLTIANTCGLVGFASRMNKVEQEMTGVQSEANIFQSKVNTLERGVAELVGRADANDKRVGEVTTVLEEVSGKTEQAAKAAAKANERQDSRVRAENQELKKKLAYIKGANPAHKLAKMKDAEIEKLLNNGVVDIEPQITAAYDELIQNTANSAANRANHAQIAANVAQVVADRADYTARRAMDAGDTALSSLVEISATKTKPLGRSVTKGAKKSISQQVAEYLERQNATVK